jgi:hypothetical protein
MRFGLRGKLDRQNVGNLLHSASGTEHLNMSLSKEQVNHDRINLGRLVKRLENLISEETWAEDDQQKRGEAWVKAQAMAQAGTRFPI